MEFSYYAWVWIGFGAFFVPVEIVAYIVSIVKVVIDRSRIKQTNTTKRQTRLKGINPGKKLNIQFIHDEERAMKFMQNGTRQIQKTVHFIKTSSPTNSTDRIDMLNHKQNGILDVEVIVEHNLVVQNSNEISSTVVVGKETVFISTVGDNHGSLLEHKMSNASVSETVPVSHSSTISSSLSDSQQNKQKKQRPPKPKRNQNPSNKSPFNKDSSLSSNEESVTRVDKILQVPFPSMNSNDKSTTVHTGRRSSVSVTDADYEVLHASPKRSHSEDNLYQSKRQGINGIHTDKKSPSMLSYHTNMAFVASYEEVKTNL